MPKKKEEAILVDAGSFRVDTRHALKKLAKYQLPDSSSSTLFWIRCAAAGKARNISLSRGRSRLEIRFDGKPLTQAALIDPLGPLLEPEKVAPRRRWMAVALLRLLRAKPEKIEITSGPPSRRFRLRMESAKDYAIDDVLKARTADTVITVKWDPLGTERSRSFLPEPAWFFNRCALVPARLQINGTARSATDIPSIPGEPFRSKDISGYLTWTGPEDRSSTAQQPRGRRPD